jgi:putative ABC transport system permease protein
LLYGITPADPTTFGAVAVVLIAAAAIATVVQARRPLRVEPITALRMISVIVCPT